MEMKNAVSVCLISLFSAVLVVLIARSLDSQAASRLEPQLASIVEELRALRAQGGIAAAQGVPGKAEAISNGLIVYYFHGNTRCPTCRSIETQAQETVQTYFTSQLGSGEMAWKILNYEQPAAKTLATKFAVQMPVVVLAKVKDGEVREWKRLDEVWALVGDKPEFSKYVRGAIDRMLASEDQPAQETKAESPNIPIPTSDSAPQNGPLAIPIPQSTDSTSENKPSTIPIPQ